jgi:DNA-directed RNA polymerase subunit omega
MARATIEDCLKKINNRFILVIIAVLRTKQIIKNNISSTNKFEHNSQNKVLKDIADGKICIINQKKQNDFK